MVIFQSKVAYNLWEQILNISNDSVIITVPMTVTCISLTAVTGLKGSKTQVSHGVHRMCFFTGVLHQYKSCRRLHSDGCYGGLQTKNQVVYY